MLAWSHARRTCCVMAIGQALQILVIGLSLQFRFPFPRGKQAAVQNGHRQIDRRSSVFLAQMGIGRGQASNRPEQAESRTAKFSLGVGETMRGFCVQAQRRQVGAILDRLIHQRRCVGRKSWG